MLFAVLGIFQYKKNTRGYLKLEVLGKQYYIFQHPGGQLHVCMATGRGCVPESSCNICKTEPWDLPAENREEVLACLPSVSGCRFGHFFSLQDCLCPVRLMKECMRTEKTGIVMCSKLLGTHKSTEK